jgi:hypothetical protein
MARWDNHSEQDKLDTITRKRAKQNQKRRAISAVRPAKPRKEKQPKQQLTREQRRAVIVAARVASLPVEHIGPETALAVTTQNENAITLIGRRRAGEVLANPFEHFGYQDKDKNWLKDPNEVSQLELNEMVAFYYWNRLYKAFPPDQPEFGASRGFWGIGPGPALFEKPTDISRELLLEAQVRQEEDAAKWAEEEYQCSLIRLPDWTDWKAFLDKLEVEFMAEVEEELRKQEVQETSTESEKVRKERRKAFDAATQKPVKKVKASDDPMEHTKEQIIFLRWLLTTEQPAIYKNGKTVQAQKTIARKAVEEEIARLDDLVAKAKQPTARPGGTR